MPLSLGTALVLFVVFSLEINSHNRKIKVAERHSMKAGITSMGGKSVEGIEFFHILDTSSKEKRFHNFHTAYGERFNATPSYAAILAYDAISVVLKGLKLAVRTGSEIKSVLLGQKSIETLRAKISFDHYGEVKRELFLNTVNNGEIVSVTRDPRRLGCCR